MLGDIEVHSVSDQIEHVRELAGLGAGIEPPGDPRPRTTDIREGPLADLPDHLLETMTGVAGTHGKRKGGP